MPRDPRPPPLRICIPAVDIHGDPTVRTRSLTPGSVALLNTVRAVSGGVRSASRSAQHPVDVGWKPARELPATMRRYKAFDPPEYVDWTPDPALVGETTPERLDDN